MADTLSVPKSTRRVPLTIIAQDDRIQFPFVADVYNTSCLKEPGVHIQDGELVWFLSRSSEPGPLTSQTTTIACCTWNRPTNIFKIKGSAGIHLTLRNYNVVSKSRFSSTSTGPFMDIHSLVNLGKPDEPIFAVPAESDKGQYAQLLMRDNGSRGWRGRIMIHDKEDVTGYLAKGASKLFVIPGNFDQKFLFDELPKKNSTELRTAGDILDAKCKGKLLVQSVSASNGSYKVDAIQEGDVLELHQGGQMEVRKDTNTGEDVEVVVFRRCSKHRRRSDIVHLPIYTRGSFISIQQDWCTLQQYMNVGSFPVTHIKYADSCLDNNHSLDHVILQEESPITIYGLVSYSVTNVSLHLNDPSFPTFQATQSIPDYYHLDVTPASEIPIDPEYVNGFVKPKQTIQVLTANQFEELKSRIATDSADEPKKNPNNVSMDHESSVNHSPNMASIDFEDHRSTATKHENKRVSNNIPDESNYANGYLESHLSTQNERAPSFEDPHDNNPDYINIPNTSSKDAESSESPLSSNADLGANTRVPPLSSPNADRTVSATPPAANHPPLRRLHEPRTRPTPVVRSSKMNKPIHIGGDLPIEINSGISPMSTNHDTKSLPNSNTPTSPRLVPPNRRPPERRVKSVILEDNANEEMMKEDSEYPTDPYVNLPKQASLKMEDVFENPPPPMPPKKNRYSVDASAFGEISIQTLTSSSPTQTDLHQPHSPAITASTSILHQTGQFGSSLSDAEKNTNKISQSSAAGTQSKPPQKPTKPKPIKKPKPTPLTKPKPKTKPVVATRTNNVLDIKAQISMKLKESHGNKKPGLVSVERNNNVQRTPVSSADNGRPVAFPRRVTPTNLPPFQQPRGGVPIMPITSPTSGTTVSNARRPVRPAPTRPAPTRPLPTPQIKQEWQDPSDDDEEYQTISGDENDYELLADYSSKNRFPGDIRAPTLPPNHPLGFIR